MSSTQGSVREAASGLAARVTLQTLRAMRAEGRKIAMLTCYDFQAAQVLEQAGLPTLLVGDSAATTVLGAESTVAATMDFLVLLTEAVRRGAPHVFLLADMPFGSYPDVPTAVANAARFMREAGADGIKMECDARHEPIVRALAAAGVVVCAHLGLLPQRAQQLGGYKAQGRTGDEAQRIVEDAVLLVRSGAEMLLLEAVPDEVSRRVHEQTACPLIGCGAGPSCDGHVVVLPDMLGYNPHPPRFVEPLADIAGQVRAAAVRYRELIERKEYPAERHQYRMKAAPRS